ncbi:MAG: hypothetical protein A3J48_00085 [Candidatus Doudnabacteria bacterium RIFCSPHIGHO2_02_FULL_46_11]|uniref:Uncharacterized protein n=1 Tax=Candidatus Doudnabacteria bacterium RIFCSPHIGHO2_02_FULL_46_11 TaxID=1817832 RepID=A0A1F5P985_9BACT|nr:MAG: hypothetical protein A3J48_00085 [Candidatus Doudnabacteria bacterium RIFCSPHIGHO2_02_FULL_46_11]
MNPKPFTLFSLVIFLFPLAISFIWKFYALSAVLIFVLIISYLYHSSENKNLEKLDVAGAWLLMFTNTILIVVGRFTFPYFYLAVLSAIIALYFYFTQNKSKYAHGWWHVLSSLVTLFALLTYQTT